MNLIILKRKVINAKKKIHYFYLKRKVINSKKMKCTYNIDVH